MAEQRQGEVHARIVYWGVEGAGKSTSIQVIAENLRRDHRGPLRSMPTELDPSVSYDLLPIQLGSVAGMSTRIQVIGVPGGAEHAPTRKQLLDQVDGIVFVVDTQRNRLDENLACFEELRESLAAYGRSINDVPLVAQYNKRDLSDPFALEELHRKLDLQDVAAFESVATEGRSVLQALTTVSKAVIRQLRSLEAPEADETPKSAAPGRPRASKEPARSATPSGRAAPSRTDPGLRIAEVGQPARSGDRTVRIPLLLEDGEGKQVRLSLGVSLEVLDEEDGSG